jgi:hypothetical protein
MYSPTAEQLAAFRQEIDFSPESLKGIIFDPLLSKPLERLKVRK